MGGRWWETTTFLAGEAPSIPRILSEEAEAAAGPRSQSPKTSGHANQGPISQVTGRLTSTPGTRTTPWPPRDSNLIPTVTSDSTCPTGSRTGPPPPPTTHSSPKLRTESSRPLPPTLTPPRAPPPRPLRLPTCRVQYILSLSRLSAPHTLLLPTMTNLAPGPLSTALPRFLHHSPAPCNEEDCSVHRCASVLLLRYRLQHPHGGRASSICFVLLLIFFFFQKIYFY